MLNAMVHKGNVYADQIQCKLQGLTAISIWSLKQSGIGVRRLD